jgi:2-oxoglutarate dehydrogenase E1 component
MPSYEDLISLSGSNSGFIEELFNLYKQDPSLVGKAWADLFSKYSNGSNGSHAMAVTYTNGHHAVATESGAKGELQARVDKLIAAYRNFGHLLAKINPLTKGIKEMPKAEDLEIAGYNFSEADLQTEVLCDGLSGNTKLPLPSGSILRHNRNRIHTPPAGRGAALDSRESRGKVHSLFRRPEDSRVQEAR